VSSGTYRFDDGSEAFTWAPAEDGWSYAATRQDATGTTLLELHVGREVRVHVEAGGWVLRAGTVGPDVLWRRGDDEREAVADGVTGPSPAYAAALVHRLALAVGEQRRVRLLAVTAPVLATRVVDESWTRTGPDGYEAVDLATGERQVLRVEAGLVVEATGLTLTRS
jgi:hypothetical protein